MADPLFLLDSNILIYILDGSPPPVRVRLQACRPGEVVTSAVAYAEVVRGLARRAGDGDVRIRRLFEVVAVQPFDRAAADIYRAIPFKRGKFDHLIAAHALATNLTLITSNDRDFADVPGLRIEDWTLPL